MEHEHSPDAIRRRLAAGPRHSYLRDWIFGGIDGAVTTFAVVSGVSGAQLPTRVILILGFANLVADGLSMAAGNYLGTASEREERQHLAGIERRHIEEFPDGEREEVRQIFRAKGLDGDLLERVTDRITADHETWVRAMLAEEYGLPGEVRSPWLAGLSTFSAFVICGLIPLLPYLVGVQGGFPAAALLTGFAFLGIGAVKGIWSLRPWWRSAVETFGIGALAAGAAYGVGILLAGLA